MSWNSMNWNAMNGGNMGYQQGNVVYQQQQQPQLAAGGGGVQKYDQAIEFQLDQWVVAKRSKDFVTADALRGELRALGIDPDSCRPAWPVPDNAHDPSIQQRLDKWVAAKRMSDFVSADAIRAELRLEGVEPDQLRPSDKDSPCGGFGKGGCGGMMMQQGGCATSVNAMPLGFGAKGGGGCAVTPTRLQRYDDITESQLDQWVAAKRGKDFTTADSLRAELRAKGIDPDAVRPAWPVPEVANDPDIQRKLDDWVAAKRGGDFTTADAIRGELRLKGVQPDQLRPSDKDFGGGQMGGQMYPQQGFMQQQQQQMYPMQQMPVMQQQPVAAAPVYDAETERQLGLWVAAKREKDFETADAIRMDLRSQGVDPDTCRPIGHDASARHDMETESQLEQWVIAKRKKDFSTADALRAELRAKGVEPDQARPSDRMEADMQQQGAVMPVMAAPQYPIQAATRIQAQAGFSAEVNEKLDEWVKAKRQKDFVTADALRAELRGQNIDPDSARPSDREGNYQPVGGLAPSTGCMGGMGCMGGLAPSMGCMGSMAPSAPAGFSPPVVPGLKARGHGDLGQVMDYKATLQDCLQQMCGRVLNMRDIKYTVMQVGVSQFQAILNLPCLGGEEWAGDICASPQLAEQAAARQAYQMHSSGQAAQPNQAFAAPSAPMVHSTNPKGDLIQGLMRHIGRPLTHQDLAYNTTQQGYEFQCYLRLPCLDEQEFTGEIAPSVKEAEQSAAREALSWLADPNGHQKRWPEQDTGLEPPIRKQRMR